MVRRFKPSYEWAVKLSEKAAQEGLLLSQVVRNDGVDNRVTSFEYLFNE